MTNSDTGKDVIKKEIEQMEKQAQTFQADKIGPQGELMRKQAQLEYDILGKVKKAVDKVAIDGCLLYTSPSPRDRQKSRMPSSA